ncbi:MAG: transporter substrate-binding domain-containing protein, partial [Planctomycetota bacterium]
PFALVRRDGSADGFSVDLLKAVTQAVGLEINFIVGPWHKIKQKLVDGHLDVLPLVSYSHEREKAYDFTVPYLRMHGTIFVRKGEKTIRGRADLKDKEVIVMRGDTAHEYALHENLSDKLILTDTFEEAMRLLSTGKHDAVIIQQLVGLQLIKKLGISNVVSVSTFQETSLKPVDKPLSGFEQKFCIAVQDGDKKLLALLNEGLAIAIANGTYDELYKKWFSPILPQPPVPLTLILKHILLILVPILFLLGIVGLWYLKREVRKKTLNLKQEIKERKATEEALLLERDRAQRYLDTVEAIIVALDREGRVTLINQKGCRLLGYGEDELIGQHWFSTCLPQPDGMEIVYPAFLKLIDGEIEAAEYFENSIISRKGELRQIAWHNGLIRDEQGRIIGTLSAGEDITERKRTEEALRESEEKLARSKKMESLGLLAGGIARDLNNVLSGIVSYPELLLLDLSEDSKLRKPIETMHQSGLRATAIVQDLLTLARGVATTKEPLNLNDLVCEYLNFPEFKKLEQFHPTVTVKTNLDNDLFNVSGSNVHIRKVVMNLVANASEAVEGSGNVTISTFNRYVDRPLRGYDDINIGEYAILSVSDDGSGISSDDLKRIFEPFYSKKAMGRSGIGLGLTVVWNVVRDHKGYIDLKSDENGTTFELYFPVTREEISDKDVSISIKDYKGNGETILVVDDVESQTEISCKMLETLGYKTKAISNGEETVEYLKKHSVDLILLDMIMDPGINGRETYERIIKIHTNQKAIIVSGFAETEEVKETQKLGAGKFIKKPLTLEKIGLAIKEELGK